MGVGTFIIGAMAGAGVTWIWLKRKTGQNLPGPMQFVQDAGAVAQDPRLLNNVLADPYGGMQQFSRYNPFTGHDSNSMPMHARLGVRIA